MEEGVALLSTVNTSMAVRHLPRDLNKNLKYHRKSNDLDRPGPTDTLTANIQVNNTLELQVVDS